VNLNDLKLPAWLKLEMPASLAAGQGMLRWWVDGMTACLPERVRAVLFPARRQVVLEPSAHAARVFLEQGSDLEPLGEVGLDAAERGVLSSPAALGTEDAVVRLPQGSVLRKELSLPAGVRENLRQVIGFEMDRLTPFTADQVYYDCWAAPGQPKGQKLKIELAVVPAARVDPWLNLLREVGLRTVSLEAPDAWPGCNLLAPAQRGASGTGTSLLTWGLASLALLMLVGALALPLWQKRQILDDLARQLEVARKQAAVVTGLRDKVEKSARSASYLLDRRQQTPVLVEILRELTERMPDDTWLQQLDYKAGNVQLRGESSQATALIGGLEGSPLFREVGFGSPVVQLASGMERFQLSLAAEVEAQP
jgi:general secretion pathway protein L